MLKILLSTYPEGCAVSDEPVEVLGQELLWVSSANSI
jgi:hypothetical protein